MPPAFRVICSVQKSTTYIIFVGLVSLLCCLFNCEYVAFTIFVLLCSITFLLGNDLQTLLPVLFMAVMCIGQKDSLTWYRTDLLPHMAYYGPLLGILVACIVFYLIYHKPKFGKPNLLFWSMVAISASLALGGIFYENYTPLSLLFGSLFAVIFVGLYMLLKSGIKEDCLDYLAKSVVVTTIVMLLEILSIYVNSWDAISTAFEAGSGVKGFIYLGWGVSNNFGNLLLIGLAFNFYYAAVKKNGWIWLLLSVFVVIGIYFTYCRGCLVLALPFFALGVVYTLIRNKRGRLGNLICCGALVLIAGLILIFKWDSVMSTFAHYASRGFDDSGRFEIWKTAVTEIFPKEVFLGVGYMDRYLEMTPATNYYYHNTFIQFLANCGLVGAISYIFHRVMTVIVFLRKPTERRFFLGFGLAAIIGYSFIDATFFIYYFCFFYVAFLVVADMDCTAILNKEHEKHAIPEVPTVLFPCVEAGLGHIMPMMAIADSFESRYGDKCKVIKTSFFKDSGDKDMLAYEQRYVKEVIKANKLPLYGYATFAGLRVFGKQASMDYVIRRLSPCALKKSMERISSFNADVIFSTHWCTTYFAEEAKLNAYNIVYCPDADMDTEWDCGADLAMISVKKGAEDAINYLGYKPDQVVCVPFPIRKQAESISLDRAVNREKIGVPKDKFTIVLADGGYACGRLKQCVELLLQSDLPITVIPVCGNNKELYEQIKDLPANPNITYMPISFCEDMLSVVASADCFMGKSGANTVAEFAYFGVPLIITLYSTPIEHHIGDYYIKDVGCAVKVNSAEKAVETARKLIEDKEYYEKLSSAAYAIRDRYGADGVADAIWEAITRWQKEPKQDKPRWFKRKQVEAVTEDETKEKEVEEKRKNNGETK